MNELEIKICQNCKAQFRIESEDFDFYNKIKVPAPTFCPECRSIRRAIFWNEHNLYRKVDALTGKEIFSTFPPNSSIKIYGHDYWWSDKWDPMSFGKDYDFSRPFFEQIKDLFYDVPQASRAILNFVNSDYSNQAGDLKNCYLAFNGGPGQELMYCVEFLSLKDCIDVNESGYCEFCYDVLGCGSCYKNFYSVEMRECRDCYFSYNLVDCESCFGCVNLQHKKYHIFNAPYSKEDYVKKISEFNLGSFASVQDLKLKAKQHWLKHPVKYARSARNVNSGGYGFYDSKNLKYGYHVMSVEDSKFVFSAARNIKDSYDYTNWGENSQLIYECVSSGRDISNLKFCFDCWPSSSNLEYCISCHSSSNLFGCVGLNKKQYCIFNKQYTKEEYEILRAKIIEHMNAVPYVDKKGNIYKYGEFFPAEFSPFAYNQSKALDYYPAEKEYVISCGYVWQDPEIKEFKITKKSIDLPDNINDISEDVVKETLGCAMCSKAYRVLPQEVVFYKRFNIPVPRFCHVCRYNERMKMNNVPRWYNGTCQCAGQFSLNKVYKNVATTHISHNLDLPCKNKFETTYASDRNEIIYCESCYQGEFF